MNKNKFKSRHKIQDTHNIQMKPIRMKYITFNPLYLKHIIVSDDDQTQSIENHRLVPEIDDNGNINGSMLLFNHKQS